LLLTVLLSSLSWRTSQRAAGDADWVAHTHEVSTTLEVTLRHLVDVETGARGFVHSETHHTAPKKNSRKRRGVVNCCLPAFRSALDEMLPSS
jgi:hypothetical protein